MLVHTLELDNALNRREKRIVFCAQDVLAGMKDCAVLTHKNRTRFDELAAKSLDAQPLRI